MFRIGGSPAAMRGNSEIPPLYIFNSNPDPFGRQCLVGSLSGADASQKVTEAFTKVGYLGMETREIV
jgi:hypothetical protein